MKSDEEKPKVKNTKVILTVVVIIIVSLALLALLNYWAIFPTPRTGDLPDEPDKIITVSQNEAFTITRDTNSTRHLWYFVNDVDQDDVNPYQPVIELVNYSEVNNTWFDENGNLTEWPRTQNWTFISREPGTAEIYFYKGEEYPESLGYVSDYWIRIIVEE